MNLQELHAAALAAITQARTAEQAATPGPWEWQQDEYCAWLGPVGCRYTDRVIDDGSAGGEYGGLGNGAPIPPNESLLAAARNGWPAVLDSYERQVRHHYKRWIRPWDETQGHRHEYHETQLRALCADIARVLGVELEAHDA
ncbi:MAG: hypothetical protein WC381_10735 [Kiritimatiellia bacterium]|jgi:hypothetical protein